MNLYFSWVPSIKNTIFFQNEFCSALLYTEEGKDLSHFFSIMLSTNKGRESWSSLSIIFLFETEKEEHNKKETTVIY